MNGNSTPEQPAGVPSAFDVFESLTSIPGIRNVQTNVPDPALTPTTRGDEELEEDWPEQIVVVFDVDGVVAPIGGPTVWGDDVTIGLAEDGLVLSPTMCAEIDKLNRAHGAHCYWLTDWTQRMRHDRGLPGRDWPSIAEPLEGSARAEEWAGDWWNALPWWKWWVLDEWLTEHPAVRRLVWVDDHLARYKREPEDAGPSRKAWTLEAALRAGAGVDALLLAPDKHTGLTRLDLRIINDWVVGVR
jgi:hypothetical protein